MQVMPHFVKVTLHEANHWRLSSATFSALNTFRRTNVCCSIIYYCILRYIYTLEYIVNNKFVQLVVHRYPDDKTSMKNHFCTLLMGYPSSSFVRFVVLPETNIRFDLNRIQKKLDCHWRYLRKEHQYVLYCNAVCKSFGDWLCVRIVSVLSNAEYIIE